MKDNIFSCTVAASIYVRTLFTCNVYVHYGILLCLHDIVGRPCEKAVKTYIDFCCRNLTPTQNLYGVVTLALVYF